MRRIFGLLTAIILTLCLCVTAFAANDVERAGLIATVSEDGSCQINLNLTLQMDQADRTMRYPIPENAQNVLLNGSPVGTYAARGVQQVDLSGVMTTGATLSECARVLLTAGAKEIYCAVVASAHHKYS